MSSESIRINPGKGVFSLRFSSHGSHGRLKLGPPCRAQRLQRCFRCGMQIGHLGEVDPKFLGRKIWVYPIDIHWYTLISIDIHWYPAVCFRAPWTMWRFWHSKYPGKYLGNVTGYIPFRVVNPITEWINYNGDCDYDYEIHHPKQGYALVKTRFLQARSSQSFLLHPLLSQSITAQVPFRAQVYTILLFVAFCRGTNPYESFVWYNPLASTNRLPGSRFPAFLVKGISLGLKDYSLVI